MIRYCLLVAVIFTTACESASAQLPRPLKPIADRLRPTRRVVYKTVGDRKLHLHLFEPEGHQPTDRRPVFLTIHGGGWTGRDARQFYPFAEYFSRLGMLGISLEYRLMNRDTGTTVFDCVQDGRTAVRYLRRHAAELGVDPNRIVVSGGSAGGHIAAGTALFDAIDAAGDAKLISCRPDALVLYYPVIDTSEKGYGQKKIGERWRELSPVAHVKPGLPPTIIFHGTADTVTPYAGAVLFHQRMQQAGNSCQIVSHKGGRHGYFIFDLNLFKQAMHETHLFLKTQKMLD